MYYYMQRFTDSEKEIRKSLDLDPLDAMAYHNLAAVHTAQKRYKEAESEYLTELAIAPRPESQVKLAALYCITGKLDKAENVLLSCIDLDPVPPKAHYYLGGIYLVRKQYGKAENEYLRELKIASSDAEALYNLAAAYYRMGKKEKAAITWKKVINADPDMMDAYEELARYYCRIKDFKEAASYLNEIGQRGGSVSAVLIRTLRL
jgi:tetratricopeptide (TPR) repeat protein